MYVVQKTKNLIQIIKMRLYQQKYSCLKKEDKLNSVLVVMRMISLNLITLNLRKN